MRKFPRLQSLTVAYTDLLEKNGTSKCSSSAMIKFIRYAVSVPDFTMELNINGNDLSSVWTEFINAKKGRKDVSIYYGPDNRCPNTSYLTLSAKKGLILNLRETNYEKGLPHIKFISKANGVIRSLQVRDFANSNEFSTNKDWLFDILHLYPLLEEITLFSAPTLPSISNHHISQYPSIKKLIIHDVNSRFSFDFLSYLSLNLPNINQLSLLFFRTTIIGAITVIMPHTCLDLLVWEELSYMHRPFKGSAVHVKLKTDKGLTYYMGIRNSLYQVDEYTYSSSPRHIQFDITCKHLKELRIRKIDAPDSDSNSIFIF